MHAMAALQHLSQWHPVSHREFFPHPPHSYKSNDKATAVDLSDATFAGLEGKLEDLEQLKVRVAAKRGEVMQRDWCSAACMSGIPISRHRFGVLRVACSVPEWLSGCKQNGTTQHGYVLPVLG